VTLAERADMPRPTVAWYAVAQLADAILGVWMAHGMFGERVFMVSHHVRSGTAQWFSEFIATFGLLSVITGCSRRRSDAVPVAMSAYIVAAYWFTASTSFANPAVTIARAFTDTFASIFLWTSIPAIRYGIGLSLGVAEGEPVGGSESFVVCSCSMDFHHPN
jgi:glycerol uptake facilitator-like aquaporin